MIYLVQTLKQVEEQMLNTDFVIEADNEADIKTIMNISKVIVLSSTIVSGWPKSGQFFVYLEHERIKLKCCIAADTIEHACERCVIMGLPITRLESNYSSLSTETSNDIIKKYKDYYIAQKRIKLEEVVIPEQGTEREKKKKIIEIITEILQDINNIPNDIRNNPAFIMDMKKLSENKEILIKMRMGSNMEKASLVLEQTLAVMEKIELENIKSMRREEEAIIGTSVISNIDIIGELEKLKRSKQISETGMSKNKSDIYYSLFGMVGLYQKFIAKDIISRLGKIQELFSGLVSYIGFGILWVNILVGLRSLFRYAQNISLSKETYQYLIAIGLLGILWNIPLLVKNKKALMIIVAIIVAIGLLILIQQVLIVNLALV